MIRFVVRARARPGPRMSLDWRDFQGVNAGAALELYERYQRDPQSVDASTRAFFSTWTPPAEAAAPAAAAPTAPPAPAGDALARFSVEAIVGARDLAQAIRRYGHLAA